MPEKAKYCQKFSVFFSFVPCEGSSAGCHISSYFIIQGKSHVGLSLFPTNRSKSVVRCHPLKRDARAMQMRNSPREE